MESSQIKGLFIIVLAAMFAVYLGVAAATASFEAVAWVAGFLGIAFVLALGKNIWCLIPLAAILQGTINGISGSPPVWALAMVVVFTMFVIRLAMRRPEFSFRLDLLDIAVLLQAVVVGQAYLRNPAGLLFFGGQFAGGKPYYIFAAAIAAYFCLAFVRPEAKTIRLVVIGMIVLALGDGLIAMISDRSPSFGSMVLRFYSNANLMVAKAGSVSVDLDVSRGGSGFAMLGKALVVPCFCMIRPLKCLSPFRPVIFLSVAIGSAMVLLSGFRSGVAYLGAIYVASALARRKVIDVVAVGVVCMVGLAILLMSGQIKSMPFGIQRVLSVLPVEVRADAREDAENSTRWRFEMWKLALTTDRYIQNKALGDGFALSTVEMRAILDSIDGYSGPVADSQEQMLSQGSYHGFHVETIRFTGVVGLVAALFFMGVAFNRALKAMRYFFRNPLFPYIGYLCVPPLLYPFWSMLVFGSYRIEFPQMIVMAGMIKMLDNLRRSESIQPVPVIEPVGRQAGRAGLAAPAFLSAKKGRA
ncbi:hypothetical protein [Luteolibacter sp. Populi]|uniref:hypothetical protein n=1 Tax=Luteolibacter sp. Populi TaxID=3230487 RepID=UPI0034660279